VSAEFVPCWFAAAARIGAVRTSMLVCELASEPMLTRADGVLASPLARCATGA
jgi:hypothetical protein